MQPWPVALQVEVGPVIPREVEIRDFLSVHMGNGNNRWNSGIARNAPIYGDINVDAGGLVQMTGAVSRYVQIGHLGSFQVGGEVQGDITVAAGADVSLQAGGGWNGHATIETSHSRRRDF